MTTSGQHWLRGGFCCLLVVSVFPVGQCWRPAGLLLLALPALITARPANCGELLPPCGRPAGARTAEKLWPHGRASYPPLRYPTADSTYIHRHPLPIADLAAELATECGKCDDVNPECLSTQSQRMGNSVSG
ncbi:hypothetical protein B0T25DRAFT_547633 [Lasiosphaeria hispida]|uniref:Uncharacterized protein n=1 Tax=Lasiosphaeria hispida TaxID=260671 RepID=A0AAJ0HEU3_9PEZI|nr:hypothetical protein B0T25DRAFT_547633 [Lasiosphaeria hispida]